MKPEMRRRRDENPIVRQVYLISNRPADTNRRAGWFFFNDTLPRSALCDYRKKKSTHMARQISTRRPLARQAWTAAWRRAGLSLITFKQSRPDAQTAGVSLSLGHCLCVRKVLLHRRLMCLLTERRAAHLLSAHEHRPSFEFWRLESGPWSGQRIKADACLPPLSLFFGIFWHLRTIYTECSDAGRRRSFVVS